MAFCFGEPLGVLISMGLLDRCSLLCYSFLESQLQQSVVVMEQVRGGRPQVRVQSGPQSCLGVETDLAEDVGLASITCMPADSHP